MNHLTGHPQPRGWRPTTAELTRRRPAPGQLVGWRYAAWQVREVQLRDDADLTAQERDHLAAIPPAFRDQHRPYHVVLAHARGPLLVDQAALRHLHDGTITIHLSIRAGRSALWHVLNPHYAVCACHGHPHPCGELESARLATKEAARLDRLLDRHQPGTCFACGQPVTTRAKVIVFPELSPFIPGAAGPTFHAGRGSCWAAARDFELGHRLPAYPGAARLASCPGVLIVHQGDGRQECTADQLCTGHHGPRRGRADLPCNERVHVATNDGAYPRPAGQCTDQQCLGRDHSPGAPDPYSVGDQLHRPLPENTIRF